MMYPNRSLWLAGLIATTTLGVFCHAFAPVRLSPRRPSLSTTTFMSEPSDSGNDPFYDDDDVVTAESETYTPNDNESRVTDVLDLVPGNFGDVSESQRATINEILLKLESINPTEKPTTSPLLNGVWELRYAAGYTSEGALPSPTR
jgi:hypothetical protein